MEKVNAVITGIGGYVPEYVLTNEEISTLVDTSDEWIMSRVGIKERHVLKGEGIGTSYMGIRAVKRLLDKSDINPDDVEILLCATTTPDYPFPTTASIIAHNTGLKNAMTFDLQGACAGFLYALETGANYIRSGRYKNVIIVAGDKMTAITNYNDRTTCPLFGDACGAVLLEATKEDVGIMDTSLYTDGTGFQNLHIQAGGSAFPASLETVKNQKHYIYQEGKTVFKYAVANMAKATSDTMKRNHLTNKNLDWVIPHQANLRIIDAVAKKMDIPMDKVVVNIEKYGNTSAGTIPLCLWEWEKIFKKGDNIILTAFGAGFTWGAIYLKWGYTAS